ncbi:MFS transporter [Diaphorobacter aerolatus]|uniref:MFS transporter n=1 Tax=Diaphorobacter aerolatus TaxID=1288495 RepID=A0A7H0GJ35_9BURK|nr:MFS transporter [Diaphorobacter aerolatus]QNP48301.1 MFS transporter [Diaphorobacter aerolatus]
MILRRYPSLAVLSAAQALYWSCSIIGIALTALVGQRLSPWPMLATLPLALLVLGNLLAVGTIARWMQGLGRRRGLQRGAVFGIAAGLLATLAVHWQNFALFCVAMVLLGAYQASAGFYRFAALEDVDKQHKGRAAAWVIAGGIVAALIAPSLALRAVNWLATPMAGAYMAIAVLASGALVLLKWLPGCATPKTDATDPSLQRAQRKLLWSRPAVRQALCITACGHGLMILVMNATPLAMHVHGHALVTSTHVIQWHVLGMFLPSLAAGSMVDRWGTRPVAWIGAALLAASAVIALSGLSATLFLISSLLLGAGWNLMLLAGTTLLTLAHSPEERAAAQPLMEWTNSAVAAIMSFSCGALMQTLGWRAINVFALIVLMVVAWWLRRSVNASQNQATQQAL